jgi:hypothetical protein
LKAVITVFILIVSGVSSVSALSAGDDSAPEVSENSSGSNGFRGVVKEGFRNGVAGFAVGSKRDAFVSGWGSFCFVGDSKPPSEKSQKQQTLHPV